MSSVLSSVTYINRDICQTYWLWFIQRISSIVVETVLIFISRSNRFPETNQYWSKWGSTSRLTHSHIGHAAAAAAIDIA